MPFVWILALAVISPAPADSLETSCPKLTLNNGQMTLTVYLPDARSGYYRGVRFDWSGLIAGVGYRGHTFYGPWQAIHDPTAHDAVVGPAEEFGMQEPLGYDEALPGQPFYKIGVGALQKPAGNASQNAEAGKYQFFGSYVFAEPPVWSVTHGQTWVEFSQTLHGERGWGYRYVKRLELIKNSPVLLITHRLENRGTKRIETNEYCHNFTVVDGQPIGPDYRIHFPFDLHLRTPNNFGDVASVSGGQIMFTQPIPPGQALYAEFPAPPEATGFRVENRRLGLGVGIQSSVSPQEFHVYAVSTAVCPEPFISIDLAPGEQTVWRTRYTFSARDAFPAATRKIRR